MRCLKRVHVRYTAIAFLCLLIFYYISYTSWILTSLWGVDRLSGLHYSERKELSSLKNNSQYVCSACRRASDNYVFIGFLAFWLTKCLFILVSGFWLRMSGFRLRMNGFDAFDSRKHFLVLRTLCIIS